MMNQLKTSEMLRRSADGLSGSLKPETRRRLVRQGLTSMTEPAPASLVSRVQRPFVLAAGSAMALAVIALIVPSLLTTPTPPESGQAALTPVRDLSVVADGDRVVLNWADGGAARKVFRTTSHAELAHIRTLPAKTVTGETWVDEEPATAPIVYYVIE
jgi:hypothetical protein